MRLTRQILSATSIFFHHLEKWSSTLMSEIRLGCTVKPGFITETEEHHLLTEIEPHMKRLRYEKDHWDNAIYLYREREQRKWSPENSLIIDRLRESSFPKNLVRSDYVHILDLHKNGHIRPHIDSERYCGEVVSGISLLSDCVMRLKHDKFKDDLVVDLYLQRFSLYKLSGLGRYEFTHEILATDASYFDGQKVERDRRISIICRDIPRKPVKEEEVFKINRILEESN